MKNQSLSLIIAGSLLFMFVLSAKAGPVNTGSVVSGVDPNYTLVAPTGLDPLGVAYPTAAATGSTYVVSTPNAAWSPASPNSQWIAPQANEQGINFDATDSSLNGYYFYQTTFTEGSSPQPISGEWATDNSGVQIIVNNAFIVASTTTGFTFSSFYIPASYLLPNASNTIIFEVYNNPASFSQYTPTGLEVEFVPESAVAWLFISAFGSLLGFSRRKAVFRLFGSDRGALSRVISIGLSMLALVIIVEPVKANSINLVSNGDFSSYVQPTYSGFSPTYDGYSFQFGNAGNTSGAGYVTDWSIGAASCAHATCPPMYTVTPSPNGLFDFLFLPNTATNPGAVFAPGNLWQLSGTASDYAVPGGGNFVAMDSGFFFTISQNISGLLPNTTYSLSFYTAATQQFPLTGTLPCGSVSPGNSNCTTEYWQVNLGSMADFTPVITAPGGGFAGWVQENLTFTTGSTIPAGGELLTFLAVGQPEGVPPMALLADVCLVQGLAPPGSCSSVPEPSLWLLLGSGLAALGGLRRLRRFSVSRC